MTGPLALLAADAAADRRAARAVEQLPALLGHTHQPDSAWTCDTCGGTPWPCSPAMVLLAERYASDPASLAVLLADLEVAAR